jgi:hypothetical protein
VGRGHHRTDPDVDATVAQRRGDRLAASGSSGGSSRLASSITVTVELSARHAVAISQPTTPANDDEAAGHLLGAVASRGVHGMIPRRPSIGGIAACEPVHMTTAWRAVNLVSVPSGE